MAKLKLIANPTFKAKVGVPVAGGVPVEVELVFKHRTQTELDAFMESRDGKPNSETFLDMVQGWDLEDEFNPGNVDLLLQNYIGTTVVAYRVYVDELVKTKLKN